jgi:glycosyltransferase involved in cell wall biosynthesis
MSESQRNDSRRHWFTESVKRRIVSKFAAALVGGTRHSEYAVDLGMRPDQIFYGYDVVDNEYFATATTALRALGSTPARASKDGAGYFLVVSRFIGKKNLPFVLRVYAEYRRRVVLLRTTTSATPPPLDMVLLGDGPLRSDLERLRGDLGLCEALAMPGFVQYDGLPPYFAGASALIHASSVEQWGLVVNEAMASSLPTIVSTACGCVPDLVEEGVTGYRIDPSDGELLVRRMIELTVAPSSAETMGRAARRAIEPWGPERFAMGLEDAGRLAMASGPKAFSAYDPALFALVARQ